MGIPATGRAVEFQAIDIVQIADGVATAHWGVTDMVALLTQLGVMPEPG
jgi:predicted ester cyclase